MKAGEVIITLIKVLPTQSRLVVEAARGVDLCLPRRFAVLRHGGESMKD